MIKATEDGSWKQHKWRSNKLLLCFVFFGWFLHGPALKELGIKQHSTLCGIFDVREMVRLKIGCLKSNSVPCFSDLRLAKTSLCPGSS